MAAPSPEYEGFCRHIGRGEKIPAVKSARDQYGLGLKEAKDLVEEIMGGTRHCPTPDQFAKREIPERTRTAKAARLIAAAPQMAEALQAQEDAVHLHSMCECAGHSEKFLCGMCATCNSRHQRASELRTAALALARGESQP